MVGFPTSAPTGLASGSFDTGGLRDSVPLSLHAHPTRTDRAPARGLFRRTQGYGPRSRDPPRRGLPAAGSGRLDRARSLAPARGGAGACRGEPLLPGGGGGGPPLYVSFSPRRPALRSAALFTSTSSLFLVLP